jgi:hypothetical protein
VESPGKLIRKYSEARLTKDVSLRKVDSVFPRQRRQNVITRFVGKVQELESGLETGVTGASPPTVTSMGGSFYLGGLVQGRRP